MNRMTLLRRYGPLLAVAAVQLLIIAVVPSTAERDTVAAEEGPGESAQEGLPEGVIDPATGQVLDPATGQVLDPATGRPVGANTGGGPGGTAAGPGGGAGGSGGGTTGDTKHCVGGRQYDPALYDFAPPCVPKFTGSNPGDTSRGVTATTIKVVVMRGNYGEAVNRILEQQGSPRYDQFEKMVDAAEKWINARYELYGRKIDFEPYQIKAITGGQSAPEDAKLREEMRQLVRDRSPFAVSWANSVSSATYDQLSKLKVVNIGGYGFTDSFSQARRPYHWDVQMGGYQLADRVSTWYCSRMHGNGTAKAVYAGTSDDYPNLHTSNRVLGIISTIDPENTNTMARVIQQLKDKCGVNVTRTYTYEQNIQTLQEQRTAAYRNMTDGANPATTVMCFCDQVAPQFLYYTCWDNGYFPEHIIVATGVMDLDRVAQSYDHGVEDEAARRRDPNEDFGNNGKYPGFENAFGLAQFGRMTPKSEATALKVWKAGGYAEADYYDSAEEDFHYLAMEAGIIQMAGPKLTPFTFETGAHKLGTLGSLTDERVGQRSFGPGDYTWNDSLREVYFSPTRPSPFNNVKGSYLSLNGGRWFTTPQFPAGLLALPPKPRQ